MPRRACRRSTPIPPACPADCSASHYSNAGRCPRIPPACPADRSASHYSNAGRSPPNPAGSSGGLFGFPLQQCRPLPPNPASSSGGSFGFPLQQCRPLPPNPAGLSGGLFGFPLQQCRPLSSQSRRLVRRIVRLPTTAMPAALLPIPPARPADRSASHYSNAGRCPRIPPACPADRSASHYSRKWKDTQFQMTIHISRNASTQRVKSASARLSFGARNGIQPASNKPHPAANALLKGVKGWPCCFAVWPDTTMRPRSLAGLFQQAIIALRESGATRRRRRRTQRPQRDL